MKIHLKKYDYNRKNWNKNQKSSLQTVNKISVDRVTAKVYNEIEIKNQNCRR